MFLFGLLKIRFGKKCINWPADRGSHLLTLKAELHKNILVDSSIVDLGGTMLTPISDVLIYIFDPDFEEEIELSATSKLLNGQKNGLFDSEEL